MKGLKNKSSFFDAGKSQLHVFFFTSMEVSYGHMNLFLDELESDVVEICASFFNIETLFIVLKLIFRVP